ncbi:hypothetical protein D0T53_13440 [Dysgonomonas sp. 216]|uniref:hypothetical protein n=1 Tax=Dysgonomonas sp. 216 TaxID=2302934 RepID=UPI0013D67D2A|nr:hypothetical protein [Dysgonomonas sp. 216]NDW19897.1 hypothetical protein [Dysgonomonas sp. 216]
MSRKAKVLFIEPTNLAPKNGEVIKFTGFVCPNCNGRGHFISSSGYHGSETKDIQTGCSQCEGEGKLRADVVVRWMPDKKEVE